MNGRRPSPLHLPGNVPIAALPDQMPHPVVTAMNDTQLLALLTVQLMGGGAGSCTPPRTVADATDLALKIAVESFVRIRGGDFGRAVEARMAELSAAPAPPG